MDIQQMKKYFKNKDVSDKLTKQVRDVIKTTDWQKQDMREGFRESFSPLIQSQESIKKSIDEQQNATIEQLKKNQLALTDKENKLNELTNYLLQAITSGDGDGDGKPTTSTSDGDGKPTTSTSDDNKPQIFIRPSDFDENLLNKETQDTLKNLGYDDLPSHFLFDKNIKNISDVISIVSFEINQLQNKDLINTADFISSSGYTKAEPKRKNPRKETIEKIKEYNILSIYLHQLNKLYTFKHKELKGKGINNYKTPLQLLDRLELLGGSIIAGNNGVINEFSQIAHLLAQMKVITKKQLNELLKNYVVNR